MPPDRHAPGSTKFQHIADVLRMEINDGKYAVGQHIPTQQDLRRRFGVSRDTIRRALGDLAADGWIESRQGSGATVLRTERRSRPRVAERTTVMVDLKPYIASAFEAPTVTLDLMTLTAESMDAHIRAQMLRIHSGEIRPERIAVRLLLPSTDIRPALPSAVADPEDDRPRERHHMLTRRHAGALHDALLDLRSQGLVPDVSVRIKAMPLTPIAKLYLLNRTTALFGMYRVVKRPVEVKAREGEGRREEIEILDVLGIGATLFPFVLNDEQIATRESIFVDQAQRWFDSIWEHLAHDATFGDT